MLPKSSVFSFDRSPSIRRPLTVVLDTLAVERCGSIEITLAKHPSHVVVSCSCGSQEVMETCRKLAPCVLFTAESFFERAPASTLVAGGKSGDEIKVLLQVPDLHPSRLERLIRRGCHGFVCPGDGEETVLRAIQAIQKGEFWASRAVISRLLRSYLAAESCQLTSREREIFELLGGGYTNEEIGELLFISPQTVRWHLKSLYGKIGLHNRAAVARQSPAPRQQQNIGREEPGAVRLLAHREGRGCTPKGG